MPRCRPARAKGAALATAPLAEIAANPELRTFALAQGKAAFGDNCAPCHGTGAAGAKGYPNLNDDDWLWGGRSNRSTRPSSSVSAPATTTHISARCRPSASDDILNRGQIVTVANYVRSLAGLSVREGANLAEGKKIFADNCAVCHGPDGKGNQELGAPNLTDAIWLYGPDEATLIDDDHECPQRRHAGLGRPPRSRDHQVAGGLRPFTGRREIARLLWRH